MRTIAVVFAAALALGAAMPAALAAQNTKTGGTSLQLQTDDLLHGSDELSARRGGKRHGWHRGGRKWHGHHGWRRHGWRGHRGWHGWRGYGWRGYGWRHRYRHCWKVWHRGRLVKVCGWRRW
jgi:hypothetical protein